MTKKQPVGYKKPPKTSQWQPGQSGNPSGKKKAASKPPQPIPETLMAILNESVPITLGGKKQTSSTAEALLRKVLQNLFNAPPKVQLEGLKLLKALGVFELQAGASAQQCSHESLYTEEHRRLVKIIQEEIADSEDGENTQW